MPTKDYPTSFWTPEETDQAIARRKAANRTQQVTPTSTEPYLLIESDRALKAELQARIRCRRAGVDCETTGLDVLIDRVSLLQIVCPKFPVLLVDFFKISEKGIRLLQQFFSLSRMLKIMHHGIFDWAMLYQEGIVLKPPYFDTELAWLVLHQGMETPATLAYLSRQVLKKTLSKAQQTSDWSRRPLSPEQLDYAAVDGEVLLQLQPRLDRMLVEEDLVNTATIEFNCLPAIALKHINGVRFDQDRWNAARVPMVERAEQLYQDIQQHNPLQKDQGTQLTLLSGATGSFNPNSPVQVRRALDVLGIKTKTTRYDLLAPYATKYPFIRALIDYRRLQKTMVTFEKTLPERIHPATGRIHAQFFQLGTVSGRVSSNSPNVLNIPRVKEGRRCIAAAPGNVLVKADYSQMELRIAARLSNDPLLVEAYQKGEDIHRLTASFLLDKAVEDITDDERQLAKAVNFGLLYLMQAKKFQIYAFANYGVAISRKQAELFIKRYFELYEGIKRWHLRTKRKWQKGERSVRTLAGRRRLWSGQPPLTEMTNQPVQGLNADITKIALGQLVWALPEEAMIILSPYDEILVECPEPIAEEVVTIMQHHMIEAGRPLLAPIPVVVDVKVGSTWG